MHSEQAAFLRAIREYPDDDTPRLVYADWLQDDAPRWKRCVCLDGQQWYPDPSDSLRTPRKETCRRCHGTGKIDVQQRNCDRAEFIRVQCKLAETKPHPQGHTDTGPDTRLFINSDMECNRPDCDYCKLRRREWELRFHIETLPIPYLGGYSDGTGTWTWHRGFMQNMVLDWSDWLTHHAAILAHPDVVLREVRLTTEPRPISIAHSWTTTTVSWEDGTHTQLDPYKPHESGLKLSYQMKTREELLVEALPKRFKGHCPNHPIEFVLPENPQVPMHNPRAPRGFFHGTV